MGKVGVVDPDPLTAMRALIRTESIKLEDSPFDADDGSKQSQFKTELKVLKGAEQRNGETFQEFFTFPSSGQIKPGTKTGQYVAASLRGDAQADTLEELVERLQGTMFVAQIGLSKNGEYSRVKHDTIGPAPEPRRKPPEPPEDGPESDLDDLPF